MKVYIFIGIGRGVPGLPHELTDIDAKRLGVEKLLQDAIRAGTYEEVKTPAVKKSDDKSAIEKEA